jgi:hypothetical protein
MNSVCATGIDSILQSSALPSKDSVCRKIIPSRVHVTTAVGSKKVLTAYEVSHSNTRDKGRVTCSATTGPSAILVEKLISSRRPPHFRVFFTDILLSPPRPIHRYPSAVPAAMAPVDETERQSTNGGDSDTADDCGSEAGKCCDCARGQSVQNHLLNARLESTVSCLKSKWSKVESYPPLMSSLGRSGMNFTVAQT